MKRGILYLAVLLLALLCPTKRTELGKLKPVEAVMLYEENDQVILKTDTEDRGSGATVKQALQNMKESSSGIIYMDTADYLLIEVGAEHWIDELRGVLKKGVRICNVGPGVEPEKAASFLRIHKPQRVLESWTQAAKLQTLTASDGEYLLQ